MADESTSLPLSNTFANGYDRDATIRRVDKLIMGFELEPQVRHGLASTITDAVFLDASKDTTAMAQELWKTTDRLALERHQLEDAETVIAKIGGYETVEARKAYEAALGTVSRFGNTPLANMAKGQVARLTEENENLSALVGKLRERVADSMDADTASKIEAENGDLRTALRSILTYAENHSHLVSGIREREEWYAARDFARGLL